MLNGATPRPFPVLVGVGDEQRDTGSFHSLARRCTLVASSTANSRRISRSVCNSGYGFIIRPSYAIHPSAWNENSRGFGWPVRTTCAIEDASASEGTLLSFSAAAAGPLAFPRGKKRGHGQTEGYYYPRRSWRGADDLRARVDGGGITEGGGGLPRQ